MHRIVLLLCFQLCVVSSYRILGIFPTPSYSHYIVYQPIWKQLASRGHDVVVAVTHIPEEHIPNVTIIDLTHTRKIWEQLNFLDAESMPTREKTVKAIYENNKQLAEAFLSHPDVQKLIRNESEHFDLYITEWLAPTLMTLGYRFKCPMIGVSSIGLMSIGYKSIGNPTHPVVYPNFMIPSSGQLSFWERFSSVYFELWYEYYVRSDIYPFTDMLTKKYVGNGIPPVSELINTVSLVLVNINPLFNKPRANLPNVIEFNGFHIEREKQLPNDLKNILDEANEGAIYMSLGNNVNSSFLPNKTRQTILETFSELPYRILWKYENYLPNKPDNLVIKHWFPQQDILRHRNIKLFITQGGLQSLEEAIRFRLPILGIPIFADQPHNIARMVDLGVGLGLDPAHLNKTSFKDTINEIITNYKYRDNVNQLADLLEDQPGNQLDNIIWWIEYIIRHNGAKHLKSPYADIPWYQFLFLDIIAFVIINLLLVFFLIYYNIKLVYNKINNPGKHKTL